MVTLLFSRGEPGSYTPKNGVENIMNIFEKNKILRILITINISLLILYLISNYLFTATPKVIGHWFDLDSEATIAAWFSSSQLLIIFFMSLFYSTMTKDESLRRFYLLLSLAFLFFSMDETSAIHEGLTVISKKTSVNSPLPGAHGMWIFIYSEILLIAIFVFRKSVVAFFYEKAGRVTFLAGGIIFVIGGVGLEIIGYFIHPDGASKSVQYIISTCLEESFELFGESLLIYSLLSKIDSAQNSVSGHK